MHRITLQQILSVGGWRQRGVEYVRPCPLCGSTDDGFMVADGDNGDPRRHCRPCGGRLDWPAFRSHLEAIGVRLPEPTPATRVWTPSSPPPNVPTGTVPEIVEWRRLPGGEVERQFVWRWLSADGPQKEVRNRKGCRKAGLVFLTDGPETEAIILTEGAKCAKHAREKTGRQALAFLDSGATPTPAMLAAVNGRRVLCWPDVGDDGAKLMQKAGIAAWAAGAIEVRCVNPARLGLTGDNEGADDWTGGDGLAAVVAAAVTVEQPAMTPGASLLDSPPPPPRDVSGFPAAVSAVLSESDLAAAWLADRGRENVAAHADGSWWAWADRWVRDEGGRAVSDVATFGRNAFMREGKGGPIPDPKTGGRRATAAGALALARPAVYHAADQWDADPEVMGLPEGAAVDLGTGKVRPQTRADRITRSAGCAPAESLRRDSRWLTFLKEAVPADVLPWLQVVVGYALSGSTRERLFLFIYGPSKTGKGTFLTCLRRAFGTYVRSIDPEDLMEQRGGGRDHPAWLADLAGQRLVLVDEVKRGARWNTGRVKALVSGETIRARKMRQDYFEFTPQAQIIVAGNHAPRLDSADTGLTDRLRVVPFVNEPAVKDKRLLEKIETPDVLRWGIEGARVYAADGMPPTPTGVADATDRYHATADVLAEFLTAAVFPVARPEFYRQYKAWAEPQGRVLAAYAFNQTLREDYLMTERKRGGAWTWVDPPRMGQMGQKGQKGQSTGIDSHGARVRTRHEGECTDVAPSAPSAPNPDPREPIGPEPFLPAGAFKPKATSAEAMRRYLQHVERLEGRVPTPAEVAMLERMHAAEAVREVHVDVLTGDMQPRCVLLNSTQARRIADALDAARARPGTVEVIVDIGLTEH